MVVKVLGSMASWIWWGQRFVGVREVEEADWKEWSRLLG